MAKRYLNEFTRVIYSLVLRNVDSAMWTSKSWVLGISNGFFAKDNLCIHACILRTFPVTHTFNRCVVLLDGICENTPSSECIASL